MKRALLKLLLLGITLAVLEVLARVAFAYLLPPDYARVRAALAGKSRFQPGYQKTTEQAYLLYVPTPNMLVDGQIDHNSQGYRGKAVPMDRTAGVYRILCLGGSTTYGWTVRRAESAYPAQLEILMNEHPSAGYRAVEVINGGAPYATSAEMLTGYHFKFHYYKPDLVILNEGGNDAEGMIEPNYHPDYSNWRQAPVPIRPLPPFGRRLIQSRLISLLLVPALYGQNPGEPAFIRDADIPPAAVWYPRTTTERAHLTMPRIPLEEYAFAHNMQALILAIQRDGAKVLLMPFRESPSGYPPAEMDCIALNRKLMEEYAAKYGTGFAPFPADAISRQNWVDSCHLNAAGEIEKARYILPFVQGLIAK